MKRLYSHSCSNLHIEVNQNTICHQCLHASTPGNLQYTHHLSISPSKDLRKSWRVHVKNDLSQVMLDISHLQMFSSLSGQNRMTDELHHKRHGYALAKNQKPQVNIMAPKMTGGDKCCASATIPSSPTLLKSEADNVAVPVSSKSYEPEPPSANCSDKLSNAVLRSNICSPLENQPNCDNLNNKMNRIKQRVLQQHLAVGPNLSWSPTTPSKESRFRPRLYSSQLHRMSKLSRSTKVQKWIEGKYNSVELAERERLPFPKLDGGDYLKNKTKRINCGFNQVNIPIGNNDQSVADNNRESSFHISSNENFRRRSKRPNGSVGKRHRNRIINEESLPPSISSSGKSSKRNISCDANFDKTSHNAGTSDKKEDFYRKRLLALRDKLVAKGQPTVMIDFLEAHQITEALQIATKGHSRIRLDVCLLWACLHGNSELVKLFLNHGASPEARDAEGFSTLHLTAASGSSNTLDILLEEGARVVGPPSWDNRGEYTPIMIAAMYGLPDIVALLIQRGADIDAGLHTRSITALHYAVRSGSTECVQLLTASRATINPLQLYSETPLHIAVEEGLSEIVEILLKSGADVRACRGHNKTTCLHISAQGNYFHISHQLLKAGADANQEDSSGRTALHFAAKSQCFDTVQVLLNYKAKPNAKDCDGKTPLHKGIFKGSRNFECLRLLLEAGADPNIHELSGYTPLHLAALNDSSYCVKLFLKHGGDVTQTTKGGISALNIILRRTPSVITYIQENLNNAISYVDHDQQYERDGQVQLDFGALLAGSGGGPECHLMSTFIQEGQKTFLRHPLCETFLFLKWLRVRSFFVFNLVFYMTLVIALTQYFYMVFTDTPSYYYEQVKNNRSHILYALTHHNDSGSSLPKLGLQFLLSFRYEFDCLNISPRLFHFRNVLLYFIWLMLIILTIKEGFQVLDSPRSYLVSLDNILVWPVIVGSLITTISVHFQQVVCPWQYHVAALVTLCSWFELLLLIGRFPLFGLYVHMFAQVTKNFGKFLFTYLCLINAFSTSFGILFHNQPPFKHRLIRFLKTLVMMTGEIEYDEWFYESKHEERILYTGTAHFVFALFLLFGTIILMNLLVGLAVSDIQGLQKSAGLDRLVRQTELIAHFETFMFSRWLAYLIPSKLLKMLHKRILLLNSMYCNRFIMNPKTFNSHIPSQLIESIKRIARNRDHFSRRRNAFSDFRTLSNTAQLSCDTDGDLTRGIDAIRSGLEVLVWETEDQQEDMVTVTEKLNTLSSMVQEILSSKSKQHEEQPHSDQESRFISCHSANEKSRSCHTNVSSVST